jgi:hypothetical protein
MDGLGLMMVAEANRSGRTARASKNGLAVTRLIGDVVLNVLRGAGDCVNL